MTEDARPTETMTEDARPPTKPTLGDINHTNPYTNRTFGDTQTYDRGRLVAADGGREIGRASCRERVFRAV